jgi:hypothetical protein
LAGLRRKRVAARIRSPSGVKLQLKVSDPRYTDRLAAFLQNLGQAAVVAEPGLVELSTRNERETRAEVEIYLRVWRVLYPGVDVEIERAEPS